MWKLLLIFVLVSVPFAEVNASTLSRNSGINTTDTYVAFTLNINIQSNLTLSRAIFDSETNTTTSNLNLKRECAFRVEAGYDTNGNLVVNIFSLDSSDPTTTPSDESQIMRYAGGKLTLFAKDGTPLPVPLYEGQTLPDPLGLLGLSPGSSVLNGIIVQDIFQYAQENQATVQTLDGQTISNSPPPQSSCQWPCKRAAVARLYGLTSKNKTTGSSLKFATLSRWRMSRQSGCCKSAT